MFDFTKNEHEILKLWKDGQVFQKMMQKNKNSKERFRTLDGPITANGSMCIHHVWGRAYKDAVLKYNHFRGRKAHFQNGFDAQGMWVEVEVEKLLGLNDKKAILDYGLDKFTEKCIERVKFFSDMQTRQSIRVGQIMDWENSYFTNSDHNIESIWHFLKVCNQRGMLVRSYKSMPWCPRCGTSLSEHEMNGKYKEFEHKAVFAKARIDSDALVGDDFNGNISMLIWTTTPWTLPANVAIAVNPKQKYLLVSVNGQEDLLIVGKDALNTIPKKDLRSVLREFDGTELVGIEYKPMLPLEVQNFEHKIIPWNAVDAKEGTGLVHIAPGCGAEDFELGKIHGLRQIVPINEAGIFTEDFEYLAGLDTVKSEPVIFDKLRENGSLFYVHDYKHNYPFCWRCKTNVVFKLVDGWDIATAPVKADLLRATKTVKWEPAFLQKTMENWLENMGDWNISRRRFYGLPLPIYPCDCGHVTVIGSKEELCKLATNPDAVDKIPHLHRPYIDEVQIKCKCGKSAKRVPDVGDCWLDAGIAPFSTKKYFTDKKWWQENFPSQVVIEMKEQIRLWFYSQLFMSVVLTGKAPYERVIGHGTILAEDGKMFSKTGPNNIKFDDAAEKFGADTIRYLFLGGNSANDVRFGPGLIDEARRKLLGFYNTVTFFNTYYDIDKPNIADYVPKDLSPTDAWLVESYTKYFEECTKSYEDYKVHEVVALTEPFVEQLSNFYIRVNRKRFWKNANDTDKLNAYWCLYHAIKAICLAMAPITPFLSEHIWQKMVRKVETKSPEMVMLAGFDTHLKVAGKRNPAIEGQVAFVQNVISLALSLRARENLKLRQPLRTLYINTSRENGKTIKLFENILRDEINVKNIEIVQSDEQFNVPYLTVNFKRAGAVLKDRVQELKKALETETPTIKNDKVTVGAFKNLPLDLFERKLKSKTEYVSQTEGDLTVVLDTTLDDELVEEGVLREIIRTIQVARQEANLDITARIKLSLDTKDAAILRVVEKHRAKIWEETLAVEKGHQNELRVKLA